MSASVFPFPTSESVAVEQASNFINVFRKQIEQEKDAFWARKVVLACGIKTALHLITGPDHVRDSLFTLISADIVQDLVHEYPTRNSMELGMELLADCDRLFERAFSDLDKFE